MKRSSLSLFFCGVLLSWVAFLNARISFANRSSCVVLRDATSKLNTTSPLVLTAGTLEKDEGALLTGQAISCSTMRFVSGAGEMLLTATLQSGNVLLGSGDTLQARGGAQTATLAPLQGQGIRVAGVLNITSPLQFTDATVRATLALRGTLGADVSLAGGVLEIGEDLTLSDGVLLQGPGRVQPAGHRVAFGGRALTATTPLVWDNAGDIVLNAPMSLATTWTFEGTSVLNGNGSILDLSVGGSIVVAPGATLAMRDLTLKGVRNGQLRLGYSDTQLVLGNVSIELDGDVSTTVGSVIIESESRVVSKNHTWTFNQSGKLTIDTAALWNDTLGSSQQGGLAFGSPQSTFLSLVGSGTIKKVASSDVVATATSGAADLVKQTSNMIVTLNDQLASNSLALVTLINQNSQTLLSLDERIVGNSHEIRVIEQDLVAQSGSLEVLSENVVTNSNTLQGTIPRLLTAKNAAVGNAIVAGAAAGVALADAVLGVAGANLAAFAETQIAEHTRLFEDALGVATTAAKVAGASLIAGQVAAAATGVSASVAGAHASEAGSAKSTAESNRTSASNARDGAKSARDTALSARDDANTFKSDSQEFNDDARSAADFARGLDSSFTSIQDTLSQKVESNSTALVSAPDLAVLVVENSDNLVATSNDAIRTLIAQTSDVLLTLSSRITFNSNALLSNQISTVDESAQQNSNALLTLERLVEETSNAIVSSDAFIIRSSITHNSNAIATLHNRLVHTSNVFVARNALARGTSNLIIGFSRSIADGALVADFAQTSGQAAALDGSVALGRANANIALLEQDSNQAVVLQNASVHNSNQFATIHPLRLANSDTLVTLDALVSQNSSAAIALSASVHGNSNTVAVEQANFVATSQALSSELSSTRTLVQGAITATFANLDRKLLFDDATGFGNLNDRTVFHSNALVSVLPAVIQARDASATFSTIAISNSNRGRKSAGRLNDIASLITFNSSFIEANSNQMLVLKDTLLTASTVLATSLSATRVLALGEVTSTFDNLDNKVDSATISGFADLEQRVAHNSNTALAFQNLGFDALGDRIDEDSNTILNLFDVFESTTNAINQHITATYNELSVKVSSVGTMAGDVAFFLSGNSALVLLLTSSLESTSNALSNQLSATRLALLTDVTATFSNLDGRIPSSVPPGFTAVLDLATQNSNLIVQRNTLLAHDSSTFIALTPPVQHNSHAVLVNNSNLSFVTINGATNVQLVEQVSNALVVADSNLSGSITTTFNDIDGRIGPIIFPGFIAAQERVAQHSNAVITISDRLIENSSFVVKMAADIAENSGEVIAQKSIIAGTSDVILTTSRLATHNSTLACALIDVLDATTHFLSMQIGATALLLTNSITATFDALALQIQASTPTGFSQAVDSAAQNSSSLVVLDDEMIETSNLIVTDMNAARHNSNTFVTLEDNVTDASQSIVNSQFALSGAVVNVSIAEGRVAANSVAIIHNSDAIITFTDLLNATSNALATSVSNNSNFARTLDDNVEAVSAFLAQCLQFNSHALTSLSKLLADTFFEGVPVFNQFGTVTLSNQRGALFSSHPLLSLDLTLSAGARLIQAPQDVEMKANDTLRIAGRDNVVDVLQTFTINGLVQFEVGSELTFEFNDRADNGRVFFSSLFSLSVPYNARLAFKGSGIVAFANGFELLLSDTHSLAPASLIVSDAAQLTLGGEGADVFAEIKGRGSIVVENGGVIKVLDGGRLTVGGTSADVLSIRIDDGSLIDVDGDARLSMQNAVYTLLVEQGGALSIGTGGRVELNARNGLLRSGIAQSVVFDANSLLTIEEGGALLIGENLPSSNGIAWDNRGSTVLGEGVIGLIGQEAFAGRLTSNQIAVRERTAASLVSDLVQQNTGLNTSTLFIDSEGQNRVRLQNGLIISLQEGDVVSRDTVAGFVYGTNGGKSFMITPEGVRIGS